MTPRSPIAPAERSSTPAAPASIAAVGASSRASTSRARARSRTNSGLALLVVVVASSLTSGCYLAHLGAGQARLLCAREPIDEALARRDLDESIRAKLALVPAVRAFASELGLDVGGQYTSWAPWPGDRVVTALITTRPGEIDAAGFWFPIVGTVPYKGFFSLARAEDEAGPLRAIGNDVCLAAVPAYSTLGWLDDPVTGPMLRAEAGALVETLLHELVHRTVFAKDSGDFNEGLATYVGQQASIAFFASRHGEASEEARHERQRVAEERAVSRVLGELRARVAKLYAEAPAGAERDAERRRLEDETRTALAALPLETRDAGVLAQRARLGDACLALEGTYTGDLARYDAKRAELGSLGAIVAAARAAARTPDPRVALLGAGP